MGGEKADRDAEVVVEVVAQVGMGRSLLTQKQVEMQRRRRKLMGE